ncbi:MAG: 50S ribosomal protein L24 [Clostridia bacterium]|nr:50S ribosomal protein L24 [Clostridia bacterium]
MAKMHIKTGDTVVLLTGKYEDKKDENGKIKTHKVIAVSPEEGKVLVEGVNIIHKHVKPRRQGESGGIVDAEGAIYASKVALYCPKCDKGVRTKAEVSYVEKDGKKKRVVTRLCAKCGAKL